MKIDGPLEKKLPAFFYESALGNRCHYGIGFWG